MNTIVLEKLQNGLSGLTQSVGNYLLEAAKVCLVLQKHSSGVHLKVSGTKKQDFRLVWDETLDKNVYSSWHDEQELVEFGATGIALLVILELTEFTEIKRSKKGSGGDFWLGTKDENDIPILEALLEISGVMKETNGNRVQSRVNAKIKQLEKSSYKNIPAYVLVIEFSHPKAKFVQK